MSQIKITFIELSSPIKLKCICDIAEKFYNDRQAIEIHISDIKEAATLNRLLWSWKPDSFIPHELQTDADDDTAIRIVTNPIDFKCVPILIQCDPINPEYYSNFRHVIDFAEIYSPPKLAESRLRYKGFRDSHSFELGFVKLGAFLQQQETACV
jgi:DNA polymerase-3 subunit chi